MNGRLGMPRSSIPVDAIEGLCQATRNASGIRRISMVTEVARHRTAMSRTFLSRPVQQLLTDGLLDDDASFFDYGCGRGGDVQRLRELGYRANGWDPAHASEEPREHAQVVNLGYVVNVIEDADERKEALRAAWRLADEVLVVAARLDWELSGSPGRQFRDGWITNSGSFQKFTHKASFDPGSIRRWSGEVWPLHLESFMCFVPRQRNSAFWLSMQEVVFGLGRDCRTRVPTPQRPVGPPRRVDRTAPPASHTT